MSFLNPILLGFTALAAIPIIIHLLNKSRFRVVEWAAMDFLLNTMRQNSRRIQLRDVLLLILRTLAIILAALALARPTFAPGKLTLLGSTAGVTAVVVIDHSQSMGFRDGADTRFDIAKKKAKDLLNQVPVGSAVGLLLMSEIPTEVITDPSRDLGFVVGEINKAPLIDGGTNVTASLSRAWQILHDSAGKSAKEIYLVSDLQANGWPAPDDGAWTKLAAELTGTKDVRLFVTDTGGGSDDVSISGLRADDELLTIEREVSFTASIRASGAGANQVSVDLWLDDGKGGELRKAGSTVVEHVEGEQQVTLPARFTAGGTYRVEARIGIDRLEANNVRRLVVPVLEKLKVLVVDGAGDPGFTSGAGFIRAALSPGQRAGAPVGSKQLVEVEVVSPRALGERTLNDYQAIILNNVAELPANVAEALKAFVAPGRGLIVFLGDRVRGDSYSATLFDQIGLLPGRLGAKAEDLGAAVGNAGASAKTDGERGLGLSTKDLVHPVVSFFAPKEAQPFLEKPRFYKAFPLDIPVPKVATADAGKGEAEPVGNVVLRYADGRTALAERTVGRGTVLLFTSAVSRTWSDLPLRPAFLMLLRRAVQQAALGNQPLLNALVHERLVRAFPARVAGTVFTTRDPRGTTGKATAVLSADNEVAQVEIDDTPYAGFYQLTGDKAVLSTAVNAPSDEADLATISAEQLRTRYPALPWTFLGASDNLAQAVTTQRSGIELWPWLLTLAILCLLAEMLLAMLWGPKDVHVEAAPRRATLADTDTTQGKATMRDDEAA